jgi:uncharacterized protein
MPEIVPRGMKKPSLKFFKYLAVTTAISIYVLSDTIKIDIFSYDFSILYKMNVYFWGIFIQAFPFILAGSMLSSAIQLFIGQEKLNGLLGKSRHSSSIMALAAALVIPSCDCSSVTVAAGFVKKNIPLKSIIIYLLAAPILNPVVIASTIFAFPGKIEIVILRLTLAIVIALIIGNIIHVLYGKSPGSYISLKGNVHESCSCGHCHDDADDIRKEPIIVKTKMYLVKTGEELFHVLPFVVMGALVSSLFQIMAPKSLFTSNGANTGIILQSIIMLSMAFFLSVCSTSDAFIAKSFTAHFAAGPILGFMVFGPMIDIKSVIVLSSYFKKRFVLLLSLLTFIITCFLIIVTSYLL